MRTATTETPPARTESDVEVDSTVVSTVPASTEGLASAAVRAWSVVRMYPRPLLMLIGLLISLALDVYRNGLGDPLALIIILFGAAPLVIDSITAIREHRYALDYLALLAIAAAV